jgi:hypothetical protein
MKRAFVFLALLVVLSLAPLSGDTYVNGYYRRMGHMCSPIIGAPDSNPNNNDSDPGNTNPYTGNTARGNQNTYLNNYYNSGSSNQGSSSYSGYGSGYNNNNYQDSDYGR